MGHCSFTKKNRQRPEKWLFSKFSLLLHIYSSRRNFFVFTKISYLQPLREIMGGQTKRQFSTKNDATGQKNDFFWFFFLLLHISTSRRNFFCFYQIFISSAIQRNLRVDKQNVIFRLKTTPSYIKMINYFGIIIVYKMSINNQFHAVIN